MRFSHCLLIRSGHKAERLTLVEIDVSGMSPHPELRGRLLELVELCKKFRLVSRPGGKLPLFLSCVSMKYFMLGVLIRVELSCICTTLDG